MAKNWRGAIRPGVGKSLVRRRCAAWIGVCVICRRRSGARSQTRTKLNGPCHRRPLYTRKPRERNRVGETSRVSRHTVVFNQRHLDRVLPSCADHKISVNAHGAGGWFIGAASGAVQCPEPRVRARPSSEIAILSIFWFYLSEDFPCPQRTASVHSDCRIFHRFSFKLACISRAPLIASQLRKKVA
jgi:hypothetical protein